MIPEAAEELLKRRQARRALIPFTEATMPSYRAAAFHREIASSWSGSSAVKSID